MYNSDAASSLLVAASRCSTAGWARWSRTGAESGWPDFENEGDMPPLNRWPDDCTFLSGGCWGICGVEPPKRLGRMDAASRAALLAADLIDDSIRSIEAAYGDFGIIALTRTGSLAVDLEYWKTAKAGEPSPHLFARTLPNIPASEVSQRFGLTGPCRVLIVDENEDIASRLRSEAADAIAYGEVTACLGLHFDAYPPEPDARESGDITASVVVPSAEASAWLYRAN